MPFAWTLANGHGITKVPLLVGNYNLLVPLQVYTAQMCTILSGEAIRCYMKQEVLKIAQLCLPQQVVIEPAHTHRVSSKKPLTPQLTIKGSKQLPACVSVACVSVACVSVACVSVACVSAGDNWLLHVCRFVASRQHVLWYYTFLLLCLSQNHKLHSSSHCELSPY